MVARKFEKFDPEAAFRLLQDYGIRNTFVPPTALRMLRAVANPRGRFDLKLRTIASAGEALGAETAAEVCDRLPGVAVGGALALRLRRRRPPPVSQLSW